MRSVSSVTAIVAGAATNRRPRRARRVKDGVEFSTDLRLPLRYRERVTSVAPGDARTRHGSTNLADGRNLIVGGSSAGATFWDTAEVYDPAKGAFARAGKLPTAAGGADLRADPRPWRARLRGRSATPLRDGRVLLASGIDPGTGGPFAAAELFDPVAEAFTATGSMADARASAPRSSSTRARASGPAPPATSPRPAPT